MITKAESIEITPLGTQTIEETPFNGDDKKGIDPGLSKVCHH